MYEWSTGAAAEVTFAHVLLSSRKMVRRGGSVLVPPDRRRRGDPRINSDQQGTSERRKEREGGRGNAMKPSGLSRNTCLFWTTAKAKAVALRPTRGEATRHISAFRTVLTAVKVIQRWCACWFSKNKYRPLCWAHLERSFKEEVVSEIESGKNTAASQIKGRGVKVGGTF